jgi:hypothetical protein
MSTHGARLIVSLFFSLSLNVPCISVAETSNIRDKVENIPWDNIRTIPEAATEIKVFSSQFRNTNDLSLALIEQGFTEVNIYPISMARMRRRGYECEGSTLSATWERKIEPYPFSLFSIIFLQSLGSYSFTLSAEFDCNYTQIDSNISFSFL